MNQPNSVDSSHLNGGRMAGAPGQSQGNHVLQDFQLQLMLLEQQNKKRLLMARQDQDNLTGHHGPPGSAPGQGGFASTMSLQTSRAGPPPNSNKQIRRGTPKKPGLPGSPMSDAIGRTRGSPLQDFDSNQVISSQYYIAAKAMNMTPQQLEAFARQNGGRLPNRAHWPQRPPPILQQNPSQQLRVFMPKPGHGDLLPPLAPAGGDKFSDEQIAREYESR